MKSIIIILGLLNLAAIGTVLYYFRYKFRIIYQQLGRLERVCERSAWDACNLVTTLSPKCPLPAPGGWAVSADLLVEIVNTIQRKKPHFVVELGTGLSTAVIALTLQKMAIGKLCSIEHDAKFASASRELLESLGLSNIVELRLAPLTLTKQFGEEQYWYDLSVLEDLIRIDLLLVDGPPALTPTIRYPALPFFWDRMQIGGQIILDDAKREGEGLILNRWQKEFSISEMICLDHDKGTVIITKKAI